MADTLCTSLPRMVIPGGTYLATRTTVMSLFLLTPNKTVNQIFEYCLAWSANQYLQRSLKLIGVCSRKLIG